MHRYKELDVWKKSIDLSVRLYELTSSFPDEEKFGLTSQVRRASVSVPSNIAEGAGRNSNKEFNHFLSIANGSVYELETQLLIACKVGILQEETLGENSRNIKFNLQHDFQAPGATRAVLIPGT